MNNYRIYPYVFHEDDIKGKGLFQVVINHGMTAIFNDHGFIVELLDIRE